MADLFRDQVFDTAGTMILSRWNGWSGWPRDFYRDNPSWMVNAHARGDLVGLNPEDSNGETLYDTWDLGIEVKDRKTIDAALATFRAGDRDGRPVWRISPPSPLIVGRDGVLLATYQAFLAIADQQKVNSNKDFHKRLALPAGRYIAWVLQGLFAPDDDDGLGPSEVSVLVWLVRDEDGALLSAAATSEPVKQKAKPTGRKQKAKPAARKQKAKPAAGKRRRSHR